MFSDALGERGECEMGRTTSYNRNKTRVQVRKKLLILFMDAPRHEELNICLLGNCSNHDCALHLCLSCTKKREIVWFSRQIRK